MNKNNLIGLLVIFGILIGWSVYTSPSKEEIAQQQAKQDSLARVEQSAKADMENKVVAQLPADSAMVEATTVSDTSALKEENSLKYGLFSQAANGVDTLYTIENEVLKIAISSKGAKPLRVEVKDYSTYDSAIVNLINDKFSTFGILFFAGKTPINTNELYFSPATSVTKEANRIALRLSVDNQPGKYIEFSYVLLPKSYMVDFDITFIDVHDVINTTGDYVTLAWENKLLRQEKSLKNERNVSTVYYKHSADEVDYLSETSEDKESIPTSLKWVSFTQQFFSSTLIAKTNFSNADIETILTENEDTIVKHMKAEIGLPYVMDKTKQVIDMQFYFGPNKYNILSSFNLDLERQIPLGWGFFVMHWINRFVVIPVFNWLEGSIANYGIIILLLTLVLKTLLFPIAYKTYLSSAKMRVLKPEMDEINEKFPKTEDAMKKQQAIMAMYKKAGVNPMAGCVPMLLQIPILIALFKFFPASIELRHESFLWATDLSSYDSIYDLGFNIPFYGDHISLFTLLMTISTIIYTKVNMQMMPTNNQLPGMKTMMYIMPVMFLGIFNNYASGLSYYYFLANMITFAQMYAFTLMIDEDKIHKQIQANKAKPIKKSSFQARLEEMAKQQRNARSSKR